MRISYEWLKTMVDLPEDPADLVREFVRTGTEVESVEQTGAHLDHVYTAQVISKKPHPDSDHMWLCQVSVGDKNVDDKGNPQPLQIVCGAQNFEEGDKVVTATIGAVLPGDFKIKKSKLRGVESYGMNCSARELGLSGDHSGIIILPPDAPVGMLYTDYLGEQDTVIDCEITPNRPDCLSMTGIATEVSAMLDKDTHIELPHIKQETGTPASELVDVTIDDTELCSRYAARVVRNVKIGPSPEWLARRVVAAGSRPINNVVDVTNYVMYLTGQPLHAFDLGKLEADAAGKRHIVVRAAHEGEKIVTLDDKERTLTPDMAVITDGGKTPVALAGVMGGANSEIDETTCDVLLESALFSAGHTSRTSRNLDLMSEASIRFERQVDGTRCADVADIAAALFEECCGAEVCPGVVDVYPVPQEAPTIMMRTGKIRALAGAAIPNWFMAGRLERLGCTIEKQDVAHYLVTVPTNRPDLTREVDLAEEVIRLWGEGDIEPTLPAARNHAGGLTTDQLRLRKIGATLRACGLSETSTYCFADTRDLERLHMADTGMGVPVKIINPLVSDQSELRRTMLAGMLRSVAYNLDHGVSDVALYELDRVFYGRANKSQPDEHQMVCGVLAGAPEPEWHAKHAAYDFFDAKGIVEKLLETLRITKVRFKVADPDTYGWLQPGRAAEVYANKGELLGWVGNVHPAALKNFGIEEPVVAFELSVEALLRLAQRELPYQEVPVLPGVEIDLAVVVSEDVSAEQLMQRITSAGGKHLAEAKLFDVYRDPVRVGLGKKSMAVALTYRDAERTLTSAEVDKAYQKLVDKLRQGLNAEIRG